MVFAAKSWVKYLLIPGMLLFLLGGAIVINAQTNEVVSLKKVYISQDGFHPGEKIKAALAIEAIPGWHIHGNDPGDEFLIPTKIVIEDNEHIEATQIFYPEPLKQKYSYADSELLVYEGKTFFGILLQPAANLPPGEYQVTGKFSYQACDDTSCLPPKKIEFEIKFTIVEAGQAIHLLNEDIFVQIKFEKNEVLK
jgi:thiol:disulfide interchange protein DsbD